jgi:hypothetical protein
MRLSIVKKIRSIGRYYVEPINNLLLVCSHSEGIIIYNNHFSIKTFEKDTCYGDFYAAGSDIIWQNYKGYFFLFSRKGEILLKSPQYRKLFYNPILLSNRLFITEVKNDQSKDTWEIDSNNKTMSLNNIGNYISAYLIYNDMYGINILGINKSTVVCFNIWNQFLLWQADISEIGSYEKKGQPFKGEIKKIMGVYRNTLLVILAGGKLLGLNIDSGKIEWLLEKGILPDGRSFTTIPQAEFLQFNDSQDKLLAFHYLHLVEIDLASHAFVRFKNIEQSFFEQTGQKLKIISSTLKGSHFFFTAQKQGHGFGSGIVGAFNIETEQIDWWHDMQFSHGTFFPAGEAPKLDENRLYVLDSEGTLHIFEGEN